MDLSKLPKLSQSHPPGDDPSRQSSARAETTVPVQQIVHVERPAPGGPEAWISLAMGLLFLLMTGGHTLLYYASKWFGTTFEPFADPTLPFPARCDFILYNDGTRIYYRQMQLFWSDLVVTSFALILFLDGLIILKVQNRKIIAAGFVLTLAVVAGNLAYLLVTLKSGLAVMSMLAVAYGIYIAIFQWRMLNASRGPRASA